MLHQGGGPADKMLHFLKLCIKSIAGHRTWLGLGQGFAYSNMAHLKTEKYLQLKLLLYTIYESYCNVNL